MYAVFSSPNHLTNYADSDCKGNYINAGIWAKTEPSVAVICACLPSLRPLFAIASRALSRMPKIPKRLSLGNSSGSGGWLKGKGSKGSNDEEFYRLDEWGKPNKRMGHDVHVRAGAGGADIGDVPQKGIKVKTEVMLVSSERLDYEDRLF
ncbi:MAG: hypothetical protein LQ338_001339 [Usnochroma carphineum]|nr:MAG: hypothetical protein LQ338_001339 [Usnochroma carphineum]